jgi:Phage T4 tail fibre
MKKSIAFFLVFLVTNSMFSQLLPTGTVTTDDKYRSGGLGLGYTTAPTFGTNKFLVNGNVSFFGNIVAGATSSTDGINAFSLRYGAGVESLSNWGSLRSSSATYMSFGVKASPTVADGWQSSAGTINAPRTSFIMGFNGFQFLTAPSQITTAGTAVAMTEVMRIDNSGNVGIGIAAPTAKLDVAGNTRINGNLNILSYTNKIVGHGDATNYYIGSYVSDGSAAFDIHAYAGVRFGDQTGNVMQVKGGNVGIGTIVPTERLDVVGGNAKVSSYSPTLILQRDNNAGGYTQGIQTKSIDGTNNWFSGVLGESSSNTSQWRVSKGDYTNPYLSVFDNGYVAIGDATAYAPLGILKTATSTSHIFFGNPLATAGQASAKLTFAGTGIQHTGFAWIPGTTFDNGKLNLSFGGSNDSSLNPVKMTFQSDGNVGIGTTSPDAKLTVKGRIHTQEVKVDLLGALVPDYVFAKDYKLKSLEEVDSYIKANSHLPEIPSATEIEKNGLLLAEMNMSLLKKIEELTLYMIEMKKEVNTIKAENKELKSELKAIKEVK